MSGPKDGYSFEEKQTNYRQPMWSAVDKVFNFSNRRGRSVMYLDTAEALDTFYLLKLGYQPQNLHVVNRSPAEVAHIQRKIRAAGFEDIHTYGCELLDAATKVAATGQKIDVLSFDGTGCFNIQTGAEVVVSGGLIGASVLTYTFLVGREKGGNNRYLKAVTSSVQTTARRDSYGNDGFIGLQARIIPLLTELSGYQDKEGSVKCLMHFDKPTFSSYMSGNHRMGWFVTRMKPHSSDFHLSIHQLHKRCKQGHPIPRCCFETIVKYDESFSTQAGSR